MIERFNRRQFGRAVLALILGTAATGITAAFFWLGLGFFLNSFSLEAYAAWLPPVVGLSMVAVFWTGWDLWRRGFSYQDFADSSFATGFDTSTAGGVHANLATYEARGAGYLLSQIALSAPLQFLKAGDLLRSRITPDLGLESELESLLEKIRAKNRWHPITDYPDRRIEVMYLVRMGLADFSPRKGSLKANT